MNRINIIQELINKNSYTSYCEVGVQGGSCFNAIQCEIKVGVDPDPASASTEIMTSDEFFKKNKKKFDIIFLDGLHHEDQQTKDLSNALKCLKKGGTIVVHDNLPTNKHMQEIPLTDQCEWTGNVWRAWVKLRTTRKDLQMHCINTDWGTSVIRVGKQELLVLNKPIEEITYEDFEANKQQWMNVISVDEFKAMYL